MPDVMIGSDRTHARSRTGVAVAAAITVLVAVSLVILLVGWVPLPELPSLADTPDPSIAGTIAFVEASEEETCIAVVEASGGVARELPCLSGWTESIAWTTDGQIAVASWDEFGQRVTVVSPTTGEVTETIDVRASEPFLPERLPHADDTRQDGTRVAAQLDSRELSDGVATLTTVGPDGTRTTIASLTGPRDYAFRSSSWSPEGDWVLASDSRGRLIVVADDGDPGPRLLVDTGDDTRWQIPAAWYVPGNSTGTVDLDEIRAAAG